MCSLESYMCGFFILCEYECCKDLEVNDSIMKSHCSYPEMATNICKKYDESQNIEYAEAVKEFKKKVCELYRTL